MSKKTITLCVALILALTLGLGGTLAYLTDTDADKNVMTVGRVQIVQNEQQRVEDGNEFTSELEQFENDKMVLPSTDRDGTTDEIAVGDNTLELADKLNNYIDKIVSATNTGNTDAWVRTLVAVPNGGDAEGWLHLDKAPGFETYWDLAEKVAEIAVDGISYDVLAFVHKEAVQPGVTTYPSLSGLYMDEHVDMDEDGYYIVVNNEEKRIANFLDADGKLNVLVLTQAVQADGFADAVTAFEKAFPYGDNNANVQGWFTGWTAEDIGSPGDKSPTNSPVGETISVSTAAEFSDAISKAEEGDVLVVSEDIDFGNNTTKIEKKITVDLNGKTLSSAARNGTLYLTNGASIKNGTIKHNGTVAGIKVWQATSIENITIELAGKSGSNNTITGISVQEGTGTYIKSMKNVTIISTGDNMVYNGLETYNCGNRTDYAIGNMENVKIDVNGTAFVLSAPAAKATKCEFKGDVIGIDMHLKGVYNVSLELEDCDVSGATGIRIYDEAAYPNPGKLTLTYDGATTIAGGIDTTGVVETAQVTITQK